jgi:hypothetical protein
MTTSSDAGMNRSVVITPACRSSVGTIFLARPTLHVIDIDMTPTVWRQKSRPRRSEPSDNPNLKGRISRILVALYSHPIARIMAV